MRSPKLGCLFSHSPKRLGLQDVRVFQVHLVAGGISWPTLNQTVCARRLAQTRPDGETASLSRTEKPRWPGSKPHRGQFLVSLGDHFRMSLDTAYAAGPRASEAVGIKVADIDSNRMLADADSLLREASSLPEEVLDGSSTQGDPIGTAGVGGRGYNDPQRYAMMHQPVEHVEGGS